MKSSTQTTEPNMKLRWALLRSVAAFILAAVLLWASGFGIFDLLSKPVNASEAAEEEGAYVSAEVNLIIGFCAEEVRGNKVIARYGLIPMNGQFIAVRFTGRYLESADAVLDSTYELVNGKKDSPDVYVNISGTLDLSPEDLASYVYDWFGLNREQLISMGAIYDTDDYATFLSDYVINVDMIGGVSRGTIITCTVGAGILVLYALAEMLLMLFGFYLPEEFKAKKKKSAGADTAGGANPGSTNFYEDLLETYTSAGNSASDDIEETEEKTESLPEDGEEAEAESEDEPPAEPEGGDTSGEVS